MPSSGDRAATAATGAPACGADGSVLMREGEGPGRLSPSPSLTLCQRRTMENGVNQFITATRVAVRSARGRGLGGVATAGVQPFQLPAATVYLGRLGCGTVDRH